MDANTGRLAIVRILSTPFNFCTELKGQQVINTPSARVFVHHICLYAVSVVITAYCRMEMTSNCSNKLSSCGKVGRVASSPGGRARGHQAAASRSASAVVAAGAAGGLGQGD